MSLVLVGGYGGLMSLAQVSFAGICAYTIGILTVSYNVNFWLAVGAGLALTVITASLFALISIRTSGNYFLIMTLTFAQMLYQSALQWTDLTGGYRGILGIPKASIFGIQLNSRNTVYFFCLAAAGFCYIVLKKLVASPYGIALQGVRDNDIKMRSMGYKVNVIRFLVVVIGAFFAGISGTMQVVFYNIIGPDMIMGTLAMFTLFMALLGGITKLEGAFVGAVVYVFLDDWLRQYTLRYQLIIGIVFVLIVMFIPNGLLSLHPEQLRKKFTEKKEGDK